MQRMCATCKKCASVLKSSKIKMRDVGSINCSGFGGELRRGKKEYTGTGRIWSKQVKYGGVNRSNME